MKALALHGNEPEGNLIWVLICAMISASPQRPWIWALLMLIGVVVTRRRER
ncbi:hypothetical protein [Mangrovactinospora gilvigrisea]|uniref:hypothetical protein n=1 Tax=Mangrovactinospora gilvigrisea TaxID=1428644 RepID=UPI000ABFF42F|nr:hypothetical protein [Mangrovactinospora gilvigrisea]